MDIRNLLKSSGIRNFAKLFSANVVAQVIGLIVYPILTRIYAPEDFGLLNLFLSIGGVLTLISIAEYQYAIVLPKDEKDAVSIFQLGFLLLSCSSICVAVSALFSDSISQVFNAPLLSSVYWLLPIYVFVMGAWNLFNYWFVRLQKFGTISMYQISQSVLASVSKIILGMMNILRNGMVYSTLLAPIVSLFLIVTTAWRHVTPLLRGSWNNIRRQAKKYNNFPLYVMPRGLLNTLGGNLPTLLLTPYFGLSEIGFLGMALTLSFRPINIVCSSLYQVLYQKITEKVNRGDSIIGLLRNFILRISLATVCLFALLYYVLPSLVSFLLGEEWAVVSDYIRIFLPWLLFIVLNTSLSFLPDVFSKQSIYLIFEVIYIVARLAVLLIGIRMDSMYMALLLFSLAGAFVLFLELCWFGYMVMKYEKARN